MLLPISSEMAAKRNAHLVFLPYIHDYLRECEMQLRRPHILGFNHNYHNICVVN